MKQRPSPSLPFAAVSGGPLFPHVVEPHTFFSKGSVLALRAAMRTTTPLVTAALPRRGKPVVGLVATQVKILAAHQTRGGGLRALLEGGPRVRITGIREGRGFPRVRVLPDEPVGELPAPEAERMDRLINKAAQLGIFPEEIAHLAGICEGPKVQAYLIASQLKLKATERADLLNAANMADLTGKMKDLLERRILSFC